MKLTRLLTLLLLPTSILAAQSGGGDGGLSVRLRLVDELRVGRAAPAVVLPYATRDGLGPADQPFDLAKELGRVVVLVFSPGDTAAWRAISDSAATLISDDVVLAGISADSLTVQARVARELDLPFKLLSDPALSVAHRYDAADGRRVRHLVVLIGRTGDVRYIEPASAALDPQRFEALRELIAAARSEGP